MTAPDMFHAMVLSAGYGTRLAPLTDEIPKPLVPIGDRPLLGQSLEALHEAGAARLVVNVHHHAEQISAFVQDLGFEVHLSHEENILGTAGGIARARETLRGAPVIIVNGDIVGALPVKELLEVAGPGLVLAVTPRPVGEGTVGMGAEGEVVRLRGETFGVEVASGDYMGVACLGEECLASLPDRGCLVGDWALPTLRDGGQILALMFDGEFEDVGTPEAYLEANLNWLGNQGRGPTASYLGEGAVLAPGVQSIASIVGEGAQVEGKGTVIAALVLPGARARAPLSHVIVTPAGVVIEVPDSSGAPDRS